MAEGPGEVDADVDRSREQFVTGGLGLHVEQNAVGVAEHSQCPHPHAPRSLDVRIVLEHLVREFEGVEEPDATVQPLYEFEPDVETVLDALLPVYIESRIFNALLQSAAAKHAATQKAMKSASDNADKLITDYTRLANNARQAEITQQISEIVGGADALVAKK